jgi:hypothetical protein
LDCGSEQPDYIIVLKNNCLSVNLASKRDFRFALHRETQVLRLFLVSE